MKGKKEYWNEDRNVGNGEVEKKARKKVRAVYF
jgi:hypothetical protein